MNAPVKIPDQNSYQLGNLVTENLPRLQAQILLFCACGFSDKKSAAALNRSLSTVRNAKQTLFYKLSVNSSTEMITKAFANAYLRFASFLIAVFISIAAPAINDHDAIARISGRFRPGNHLRMRSNGRPRNGNGVYWSPETNELVWS